MAKPLLESFLLSHLSVFSEVASLARLVKAEIMSPYSGILINTGVGNPALARLLYQRRVLNSHGEGSWYSTSL